jgi:hypothetical protein
MSLGSVRSVALRVAPLVLDDLETERHAVDRPARRSRHGPAGRASCRAAGLHIEALRVFADGVERAERDGPDHRVPAVVELQDRRVLADRLLERATARSVSSNVPSHESMRVGLSNTAA